MNPDYIHICFQARDMELVVKYYLNNRKHLVLKKCVSKQIERMPISNVNLPSPFKQIPNMPYTFKS